MLRKTLKKNPVSYHSYRQKGIGRLVTQPTLETEQTIMLSFQSLVSNWPLLRFEKRLPIQIC
jgi:hypothetical protein